MPQRFHKRISVSRSQIGLLLETFLGLKKNIVVHACCGNFPLCSTFSLYSTIYSLFFSHPGNFGLEAVTSYFSLCLVESRRLLQLALLESLGKASSNFFNSSFFQGVSSQNCTLSLHFQVVSLFSLRFPSVQQRGIFFFFFKSGLLLSLL